MAFPPVPLYPNNFDTDKTLFVVHNTTESRIRADNNAWSQEIEIIPVDADKNEVWPTNGFATIEGELLYYDAVGLNDDGKIYKLKKCARNLAGEKTKFNKKGTWIRGFVVAQHHNQLVDAVLKTENFIGKNFDERRETLDWRIRNLESLEVIFDDFACPDVNFYFNITENNSETGILAEYAIEINAPNTFNSFRIDFGDGEFTTTELNGTHRYAINAIIDPVVTIVNDKCQTIITPIERSNPQEPPPQIESVFDIPIPEIPEFPDFNFVPCEVPEPDINLPPIIFPCVSLESGGFPSIIDTDIPSQISIVGPSINITQSIISIVSDVPSIIIVDPPVPPTIIVDPPIPPTIIILPPESSIALALNFNDIPKLEVDWGDPKSMQVQMVMAQKVKSPKRMTFDPEIVNKFGSEFSDLFPLSDTEVVEYESVGIPSEIKVVHPEEMPMFQIDSSSLPKTIKIETSGVNIPKNIQIFGPDSPIPNTIVLDAGKVPETIGLVYQGNEIPVKVETEVTVKMESSIPDQISLVMPQPIPSKIVLESDLPDTIMLKIPENLGIPLILPDKMPEIELVYKGAPIELKLNLDAITDKNADGQQCVRIVPCR